MPEILNKSQPDYYEMLQVSPNADAEFIQTAYKRLVERWLADRRPGDPTAIERLSLLDKALVVLSDPVKRREYDSKRSHSNTKKLDPDSASNLRPVSNSTIKPVTWTPRLLIALLVITFVALLAFWNSEKQRPSISPKPSDEEQKKQQENLMSSSKSMSGTLENSSPVPLSPDALFAHASPAVVLVEMQDRYGHKIGSGSGFMISTDGLIVTNYHVVEKAEKIHLVFADGIRERILGVVAFDSEADLAILKATRWQNVNALSLAIGDLPPIGTKVFAIGNPLGLANTLSDGIVSGHRVMERITEIQTTAPISPGSSGGPLLLSNGTVVGVTTSLIKGGQNLNFAVSSSHISEILKRIDNSRSENSAYKERLPTIKKFPLFRKKIVGNSQEESDWMWEIHPHSSWAVTQPHSNAIPVINEIIRREPYNVQAYLDRGNLWYWQIDLDDSIRYEKAVRDFEFALKLDPNCSDAFYCLGNIQLIMGGDPAKKKAISNLNKAISINPNLPYAYYSRAMTWSRGESENIINDYDKVIQLLPNCYDPYKRRGNIYAEIKDYDKAIVDYSTALKLAPKNPSLYIARARALEGKKNYSAAIDDYQESIRLNPNSSYNYMILANFLATCPEKRLRDGKRAVDYANKAIELSIKGLRQDKVLSALAAAYAENGQFNEAVRTQMKALEEPDLSSDEKAQYNVYLELYKKKQPLRESR